MVLLITSRNYWQGQPAGCELLQCRHCQMDYRLNIVCGAHRWTDSSFDTGTLEGCSGPATVLGQ